MTKQEWLIHILNGGKGTSNFTDKGKYINFKNDRFLYKDGSLVELEFHKSNFAVYEEPKKMIKVAPYLYWYKGSDYCQTVEYFKDDYTFIIHYGQLPNFKRLTALEIEVEDYEQN